MATNIFGVETALDDDVEAFFEDGVERAKSPGAHSYFADWFILRIPSDSDLCAWAVTVSSGFPDAWKIAAALALLPLLFTGLVFSWWVVPGVVLWVLSFLSSSLMRYIVLRIALRKHGYAGKIRRLGSGEVMRRVMRERWDKQK